MVREGLGSLLSSLMSLNNQKSTKKDKEDSCATNTEHGKVFHSLPMVDKRQNKKRLVPRGSPSRDYSKKKG